jgi:RNA polymerase sigma-70 factor, ECF subfamily
MNLFGDNDLIGQYNRGAKNAFNQIFDAYYYLVFRYVRSLTQSVADAEDITSETFVKFAAKQRQFANEQKLKAFLFLTAKNIFLDKQKHNLRRQKVELEIQRMQQPEMEQQIERAEEDAELRERIRKEIETLPRKCRQVFILYFIEHLEKAEISKRLKMSLKTVSNHCSIAIKKLRFNLRNFDRSGLPILVAVSWYLNPVFYYFFLQLFDSCVDFL